MQAIESAIIIILDVNYEAIKYYTSAYSSKAFDPDYALYQRAICKGFDKDINGKFND